jgi:hypothetical protein
MTRLRQGYGGQAEVEDCRASRKSAFGLGIENVCVFWESMVLLNSIIRHLMMAYTNGPK